MRDMPLCRGARGELGRAPRTLIDTHGGAQVDVSVLRGLFTMYDERFETHGDEPTDCAVGERFVTSIRWRPGANGRLSAPGANIRAGGRNARGPVARSDLPQVEGTIGVAALDDLAEEQERWRLADGVHEPCDLVILCEGLEFRAELYIPGMRLSISSVQVLLEDELAEEDRQEELVLWGGLGV